jgi:Tfp pilus assembly protein PilW
MPVPYFYQTPTHAVAIHASDGESKLAKNTIESLDAITGQVESVGFVMDDDKNAIPANRLRELNTQLGQQTKPAQFAIPQTPGLIQAGPPRTGVYVLPDNTSQGTLEDILLECAGINYQDAAQNAAQYLANLDRTKLSGSEQRNLRQGANEKKAHVGTIVSVLRPGKTTQVSIHDNRWFEGQALALTRVAAFRGFLRDLLNENAI